MDYLRPWLGKPIPEIPIENYDQYQQTNGQENQRYIENEYYEEETNQGVYEEPSNENSVASKVKAFFNTFFD